jgi:two-component sensor histidine kinase
MNINIASKILVFLSFPFVLFSQKETSYLSELDSLGKLYYKDLQGTSAGVNTVLKNIESEEGYNLEKVMAFRIKGGVLNKLGLDSSFYYLNKSISIADQFDMKNEVAKSQMNLASMYSTTSDYSGADSVYQLLFKLPFYNDNEEDKMKLKLNYSSFLMKTNRIDKAILTLEEALHISTSENIHKYDLNINHSLSGVYHRIQDFEKAIEYSKKSLDLINKDDKRKYSIHNNLASQYISMEKYDSAKIHLNIVIEGEPKESSKIFSYQNLANLAYIEQDYQKSNSYCNDCIILSEKFKAFSSNCMCSFYKARNGYRSGKYIKAKEQLENVTECIEEYFSVQIGPNLKELQFATELGLIGRKDLDSKWRKIVNDKDSLRIGALANMSKEMESKYETAKKEAANKLLHKEKQLNKATIKKQRSYMIMLGLGLLSVLYLIYIKNKRVKEKEVSNKVLQAKNRVIEALNREVSHRTKNHMALATALLSQQKYSSTDKNVVTALAENENRLRALSLVNKRLSTTDLDSVLELKSYIQELVDDILFGYKIDGKSSTFNIMNVDKIELDSEKCLRLGLITNELITNSYKHAFPSDGELALLLNITIENDKLNFRYKDNGEKLNISDKESEGVNLIQDLVKQLNGVCKISFNKGYQFDMNVPL